VVEAVRAELTQELTQLEVETEATWAATSSQARGVVVVLVGILARAEMAHHSRAWVIMVRLVRVVLAAVEVRKTQILLAVLVVVGLDCWVKAQAVLAGHKIKAEGEAQAVQMVKMLQD